MAHSLLEKNTFWKNLTIFLILLSVTAFIGVLVVKGYFLEKANLEIESIKNGIKNFNMDSFLITSLKVIFQGIELQNIKEISKDSLINKDNTGISRIINAI